jgi:hypothetical protein
MPKRKERPNPKVGSEFIKEFKGKTHKLTVVKEGAVIAYKLGTSVFPSPSAAAKSITKNEVNGWKFWGID